MTVQHGSPNGRRPRTIFRYLLSAFKVDPVSRVLSIWFEAQRWRLNLRSQLVNMCLGSICACALWVISDGRPRAWLKTGDFPGVATIIHEQDLGSGVGSSASVWKSGALALSFCHFSCSLDQRQRLVLLCTVQPFTNSSAIQAQNIRLRSQNTVCQTMTENNVGLGNSPPSLSTADIKAPDTWPSGDLWSTRDSCQVKP